MYANITQEVLIMKISYECEELIDELKQDIKEFGDIDMYAFF